jgi:hypothetical protein
LLWCVVGKGIFSWCASDKITECNVLHTKPCFVSVLGTNFPFFISSSTPGSNFLPATRWERRPRRAPLGEEPRPRRAPRGSAG